MPAEQETRTGNFILKKELGLFEVLAIVVNRIIGSGIFRTPGPMMAAVAATSLFYGSWIAGGIATILSAILYAELTAMMPLSGGPYEFLKQAYPPLWTFLRGWAMFFVSETASIVAVSLVFAEYAALLLEGVFHFRITGSGTSLIAFALIWVHTLSNMFGVRLSGWIQDFLGIIKLLALFAIILAAFALPGGSVAHFHTSLFPHGDWYHSILSIFVALRYGFFAYSGWEGATYVAEEVKKPEKNLPLSLFLGISTVTILYLAVNSAYLYRVSPEDMAKAGKHIAAIAMENAMGSIGLITLATVVMVSTFSNVGTQIFVKARTWYAMARDGLFFQWPGTLSSKYTTPNRSLLVQGLWASVLLFFASLSANSYEKIIDYFSFTSSIFNISTLLAVYVLRKKMPDKKRPYRAWGYPWTLILILLIYTAFAVVTLVDAFIPSMLGIVLLMPGILYYYSFVVKRI